jgi:hypothetical protein
MSAQMTQKEINVEDYKLKMVEYIDNNIRKYIKETFELFDVNSDETWDEKVEEYDGCLSTTLEECFVKEMLLNEEYWYNFYDDDEEPPQIEGFDLNDPNDLKFLQDLEDELWKGKDVSIVGDWIEDNGGIQGLKDLLGLEEEMLK